MRLTTFALYLPLMLTCATGVGIAQEVDMVDSAFLANASSKPFHATPHDLTNGQAHSRFGIHGIDSIPNFNDQFFADGFDFNGNPNRHWYTNTVGNPPQMGRTTLINAPIQPVRIELDDANGNLRVVGGHPLISDATQFATPVLGSPVFSDFAYTSGADPTQFSDAIQRAQYLDKMKPDWHTLLGTVSGADPHDKHSAIRELLGRSGNRRRHRRSPSRNFPHQFERLPVPSAERSLRTVVQVRIAIKRAGPSLQLSRRYSPAAPVSTSEVELPAVETLFFRGPGRLTARPH